MGQILDFSTGLEHRVSVDVSGWSNDHKRAFARAAQALVGVDSVQSTGGNTGFYVYHQPEMMSEEELRLQLTALAGSVGGLSRRSEQSTITADTATITAHSGEVELTLPDRDVAEDVISSSWTGIASVRERVAAFKQLAPLAIAAVDSLIEELATSGDNGGPPLDERQEALAALRTLHDALGALLKEVDTPTFQWAGNPLVKMCGEFAVSSFEKLKGDPMPFAVSALLLGLFTVFGMPGLGGWLGAASLEMQRQSK